VRAASRSLQQQWLESMVREDVKFEGKVIWSDEAQFKMNGTVNRHRCVYWAPVNPHVHVGKKVNLPGDNAWCGLSSCGLIGRFF
jgi:hypothetical protein